MKRLLVIVLALLALAGCATRPYQPWDVAGGTQIITREQWDAALAEARALPGAQVKDTPKVVVVTVPAGASEPDATVMYVFSTEMPQYPAAARMVLRKGKGPMPEPRFMSVGQNPYFREFVTQMLIIGATS